jgi:hypothetical protein
MEQSPFQKLINAQLLRISRHWWNPKFHYWVHKSPHLVSTLSQMNPVHNPIYFKMTMFLNMMCGLVVTDVSKEGNASIFRDILIMYSSKTWVTIYYITRCHIPEDSNLIATAMRTSNFAYCILSCSILIRRKARSLSLWFAISHIISLPCLLHARPNSTSNPLKPSG